MAFTQKALLQSTTLTTGFVTYLTSAANERTNITKFTVHNYSAGAAVFTGRFVPSGQAGADSRQVYKISLSANETLDLTAMRHTLEAGDFIECKSDTASALNIRVSGWTAPVQQ